MTESPRSRLNPSWPALRAVFSSEVRPDWDSSTPDLDPVAAVLAVESSGVPFEEALKEALRLLLDDDGTPRELTDLARKHGRTVALPGQGLSPEQVESLKASALASCEAAFDRYKRGATGPMQRLNEDDVPPPGGNSETGAR